ncbi:hypothetical protein HHI36_012806 [Cryptolaemus montrouzieri]|uniref:Glycine-zipper-containing OmpA-like membrane domain-containing protein n=1 Tax=Cryptolaemus montrouzieri TaxID=559131 RepID=A0ABD2NGD0_9CUCU
MAKFSILFIATVLMLFSCNSARVIWDENELKTSYIQPQEELVEIIREKRQIGVGMGNEDADAFRDTLNYFGKRAKDNKEKVAAEIARGATGGAVGGAAVGSIGGPAGAGLGALKGAASGAVAGGFKAIVYDAIAEASKPKKN